MNPPTLKLLIDKYGFKKDSSNYLLKIIDKNYDELAISKLVLYVFNSKERLETLLGDNISIDSIDRYGTELVIDNNRRIDIYFEGKEDNGKRFFVIIENKINSNTHDNQCSSYYEWVSNTYKNHDIFCFFLKPFYNQAETDDKEHFKTITYDDIYALLEDTSDIYVNELKKEIKDSLMKKEYDELDQYFLNNLKEIYDEVNFLWNDINDFFLQLAKDFNKDDIYKMYDSNNNGEGYIRFYDDKHKWWSGSNIDKDNQYYFYFEIHYSMELNDIYIRGVAKRYSDNNSSKISRFMNNNKHERNEKRCYIIDTKNFNSSYKDKPLSDEWKKDLSNWLNESLPIIERETRDLARRFIEEN